MISIHQETDVNDKPKPRLSHRKYRSITYGVAISTFTSSKTLFLKGKLNFDKIGPKNPKVGFLEFFEKFCN